MRAALYRQQKSLIFVLDSIALKYGPKLTLLIQTKCLPKKMHSQAGERIYFHIVGTHWHIEALTTSTSGFAPHPT